MDSRDTSGHSENEYDEGDLGRLHWERLKNDQKLKARFEHIFRKYEHDFTGVADEIDIQTGDIVVDNGHLQHMTHEVDPGNTASLRFVRTFQKKLEHETDIASSGKESAEDSDDDADEDDSDDDDFEEDDDEVDEMENGRVSGIAHTGDTAVPYYAANAFQESLANRGQDSVEPLTAMARPAPRLAHLLIDHGTRALPIDVTDEQSSGDASSIASGTSTPSNMLAKVPDIPESLRVLQPQDKRPGVDSDTIQALGASIANQLAQLMAGSSKGKKIKRKPSKSSRRTQDTVWDYPEIQRRHRRKRPRSPSPVTHSPSSPPVAKSPGMSSLWAPESLPKTRKRRNGNRPAPQDAFTLTMDNLDPKLSPSSSAQTTKADVRRCWNCGLISTSNWYQGPHGQDLCAPCGSYFEENRRMKPFDSPTPSVEVQDPLILGNPNFSPDPPEMTSASVLAPRQTQEEDTRLDFIVNPELPGKLTPPDPSTERRSLHDTPTQTPSGSYAANTSRFIHSVNPMIPTRPRFSVEEDALLIRLKEKQCTTWELISRFFPNRSQYAVQNHYSNALQRDCAGRRLMESQPDHDPTLDAAMKAIHADDAPWNYDQDEMLLELREDKGFGWDEIASTMFFHSALAVQKRYVKLVEKAVEPDTSGDTAGDTAEDTLGGVTGKSEQDVFTTGSETSRGLSRYTAEEDARIVYLREFEKLEWSQLTKKLGRRPAMSVQSRYSHWLAPNKRKIVATSKYDIIQGTMEDRILAVDPKLAGDVNAKPFDLEEDSIIKHLKEQEKLSWDEIAARVPGRTSRLVRCRYQYKFAKEAMLRKMRSLPPKTRSAPGRPAFSAEGKGSPAGRDQPIPNRPQTKNQPHNSIISMAAHGPGSRTPFCQTEDDQILQLREMLNLSWDEIALRLSGRSANSIQARYTGVLRPMANVTRPCDNTPAIRGHSRSVQSTTPQQQSSAHASLSHDEIQIAEEESGSESGSPITFQQQLVNYSNISSEVVQTPGERPRSTSSRVKGVPRYTIEENQVIIQLREAGLSWTEIAARLPTGRTPNSLSIHWSTKLQKPQWSGFAASPTSRQNGDTALLRKALNNSSRRRSDGVVTEAPVRSEVLTQKILVPPSEPDTDVSAALSRPSHERSSMPSKSPTQQIPVAPNEPGTEVSASNSGLSISQVLESLQIPDNASRHLNSDASVILVQGDGFPQRHGKCNSPTAVDPAFQGVHLSSMPPMPEINPPEALDDSVPQRMTVPQRPDLSFEELIYGAFDANEGRPMKCRDMYKWVESKYEFYRLKPAESWKGRLRAELSVCASFERMRTDDGVYKWHLHNERRRPRTKYTTFSNPRQKYLRLVEAGKEQQRSIGTIESSTQDPQSNVEVSADNALGQARTAQIALQTQRSLSEPQDNSSTSAEHERPGVQIPQAADKSRNVSDDTIGDRLDGKEPELHSPPVIESDTSEREDSELVSLTSKKTRDTLCGTDHVSGPIQEEQVVFETAKQSNSASELHNRAHSEPSNDQPAVDDNELEIATDTPVISAESTCSDPQHSPFLPKKREPDTGTKGTTASSSSPVFVKPVAPASVYSKATNARAPKPSILRSSKDKKRVTFSKASTPARLSSELRPSSVKRVVETPMRELDSDDDELA